MINSVEHLNELLREQDFNDSIVFDSPSFLTAVLGVSNEGNVIYDFSKMVHWLMDNEHLTAEQAEEWISINCKEEGYGGGVKPIIVYPIEL